MDLLPVASLLLRVAGAFLLGSIPASNLVAEWRSGRDLRTVDTGTVSATNVFRVAGLGPFLVASALDVSKGILAVLLVRPYGHAVVAVAAGLTLIGHNWSPWLRGAGGRGVLPSLGVLLVTAPVGAVLLVGAILVGRCIGDTAPACLAAQLALTPLLVVTAGPTGGLLGLALAVPMVVKRLLGNAPPPSRPDTGLYVRRLVYDRDVR